MRCRLVSRCVYTVGIWHIYVDSERVILSVLSVLSGLFAWRVTPLLCLSGVVTPFGGDRSLERGLDTLE
jgi:hypothetical protein